MHLSAEFWVQNTASPSDVLVPAESIDARNRFAFDNDPHMVDLAAFPERISGADATERITAISRRKDEPLFHRDGGTVDDSDFRRYAASLNLAALPDDFRVRFGLVAERADMRRWPTVDNVFRSHETFDLDRFQENGLFPGDAVAVLHESADGEWLFAQSYNYAAWVRKDKIAIGARDDVLAYRTGAPFLVVTGSKVTTNYNPRAESVSELQLDMGVRLPLVDPADVDHNVDGQNPSASFVVRLPVRSKSGKLSFAHALIARSQDVNEGYLPFTRENLIRQAFKFLGERYGWGHSYNARDCTGLVSEVYKTMGILLPRNSAQQGGSPIGTTRNFSHGDNDATRLAAIATADVGDLLFSPGHVMMYLGAVDGEPYVIHDLSGSGWIDDRGRPRDGALNGVSVTPLTTVRMSPESTYFEQLYAIKSIR